MAPKNDSNNVKFSQDNVLHYQKTRNVFPIEANDWERIEELIKKYSKISIFWWSIFTFFLSLSLEFFINWILLDSNNTHKYLFTIFLAISSTATLFSLIAAITHRKTEEIKKNDILNEMDRIKLPIIDENENLIESIDEDKKLNTLKIIKALYGIEGQSKDITQKLQNLITGDRLITVANNSFVGDPVPGIKKLLIIDYEYKGEKLSKKFSENEAVILP